jgi:hypothetical protein
MADAHEERFRQHEEMLQGLGRLWEAQHTMNQDQREINERLTLAVERIDRAIEGIDRTLAQQAVFQSDVRTTLARLETIIARLGQQSANGREA